MFGQSPSYKGGTDFRYQGKNFFGMMAQPTAEVF